jgi:hypothetical protein
LTQGNKAIDLKEVPNKVRTPTENEDCSMEVNKQTKKGVSDGIQEKTRMVSDRHDVNSFREKRLEIIIKKRERSEGRREKEVKDGKRHDKQQTLTVSIN